MGTEQPALAAFDLTSFLHHADAPARAEPGFTRLIDIFLAVLLFIVLAPLMGIIALAIFAADGGPVIYAQQRIGRHGVPFPCLKFRSMVTNSQERLQDLLSRDPAARAEWDRDHKLRNDPRITWLGVFLRKTSMDELPQVFNVLSGTMSLVGPRPIVAGGPTPAYTVIYTGKLHHHRGRYPTFALSGTSNLAAPPKKAKARTCASLQS